ncbi:heavy metal-associated isoprenylated plant protein 47-like [Cynara cardunculus var. scolymus]|uniref:heavy metal-associated isoprenylated plant protein 47-like n=1 Tax=Cynara cardunculus var. scolymus TaxID=59895 RepID=UPI000D627E72|nr:heavy metal-associated isoprenylated plant protein 47-like [Cynara cardunculus var. scolymus]XP_024968682.1 heavy metal-associated isoprenylated plant protein 47-like [Cynara cardunculus var. scolymus]
MAKQNIVVKVAMINDKKTRKALKIAVGVCGVESAALIGSDKDQIKVTGEGIDSVELARLLRKGVGCTELVSVGPVEEKKPAVTAAAATQTPAKVVPATVVPLQVYPHHYSCYGGPYYHVYESPCNDNPSCTIM